MKTRYLIPRDTDKNRSATRTRVCTICKRPLTIFKRSKYFINACHYEIYIIYFSKIAKSVCLDWTSLKGYFKVFVLLDRGDPAVSFIFIFMIFIKLSV